MSKCPNRDDWYLRNKAVEIDNDPTIPKGIDIFFTNSETAYIYNVVNNNSDYQGANHACSLEPTDDFTEGSYIHMLDNFIKYHWMKNWATIQYNKPWIPVVYGWYVSSTAETIIHELGHSYDLDHNFVCPEHNIMNNAGNGCVHDYLTDNQLYISHRSLSLTNIRKFVKEVESLDAPFIVTGNEYIDFSTRIYKDIIIESGGKLTVSCDLLMPALGKIIIKPNGKLIVDGGKITNSVSNPWQGIEVWGNTTASQYPDANGNYAQGMLVLKNGATIENAFNAITNWKPGDWSKRGGIVYADNANFINNRRSAEFMQYNNFDPATGDETNYKAHFTKCNFVYNDDYINNPTDRYHVTMWGVNGIKFKGCTFTNEISSEPNTGQGIYTIDAGFTVTDFCDSPNINCPNGSIHSSFKGFLSGIESSNSSITDYLISVFNSDFQSNAYGIKMTAVNAPVIVNNNIEPGIDYGCNNNAGYGIYFDNCRMFAIENNHFTLSTGADPANYEGIHIMNTNNDADQVYNNTFDDVNAGNVTQGKNWNINNYHGLVFICNKNQNNQFDFFVNGINRDDGIQKEQSSPEYESTGNTFSINADNFNNGANYSIDYYYYNNGTHENPTQTENVVKYSTNTQNSCVNHYGDDIRLSTTEYQQKESDYNTASASYNNAVSQYDAANDSTGRAYWSSKISYYNQLKSRSAYDIIRSDMADTIAHHDLFKTWMEKLNTYSSTEALVDYYLQQGDYTTALNKVDSMAVNFTFTAYDSVEYPLYKDFKQMQAVWMADNRTIFDLNTSEINGLISIADSSKGIAGAQARSILLFAYNTLYSYSYCPPIPGNSSKSAELGSSNNSNNSNELTVTTKPNPANNEVTFSYTLPAGVETAVLSLYSANGKLIYKYRLNTGANELVYNCAHLNQGVYYYTVTSSNNKVSGKMIIVR